MRSNPTKIALVAWTSCLVLSTYSAQFTIQVPDIKQSDQARQRAEEVKAAFSTAFDEYMKYGFPGDEVRPLSKTFQNTRNGWSASLVDALDTLFVMNLQDRFKQGVANTLKIDFSKSQTAQDVSLFETTIRYLAGILVRNPSLSNLYRSIELKDEFSYLSQRMSYQELPMLNSLIRRVSLVTSFSSLGRMIVKICPFPCSILRLTAPPGKISSVLLR